jgi:hypothetical protein
MRHSTPTPFSITLNSVLLLEKTMQFIGPLAFGAMAVVNLTVLALVLVGLFRRTRVHH